MTARDSDPAGICKKLQVFEEHFCSYLNIKGNLGGL